MVRCSTCDVQMFGTEAAIYCSYKCMEKSLGRKLAKKLEAEKDERLKCITGSKARRRG